MPAPASAARFRQCPDTSDFECGHVTVPIDRSGKVPGRVKLFVKQLKRGRGAKEAIVTFPGGPGAANAQLSSDWYADLKPVTRGRNLLLIDPRGTGGSGFLRCNLFGGFLPPFGAAGRLQSAKAVERCATKLGDVRRFYTTQDSVEDVEAVRIATGADKLFLIGVSYGTRTALAYAARHPDRVSRLVLDSTVLPEGTDPYLTNTLRAIPRVLQNMCRGGGCAGLSDDLGGDVATLVSRLRQAPIRPKRPLDILGCKIRPAVTRSRLLNGLIAGDFDDPLLRASLPAAVHEGLAGEVRPLAFLGLTVDPTQLLYCFLDLISGSLGLDRAAPAPIARASEAEQDSEAVFLATLCGDGPLPWAPGTPAAGRRRAAEALLASVPDSAFAPFDRATALSSDTLNLCKYWPEAGGTGVPIGPIPQVPTLIVSGEDDLRTPLEDATRLAQNLPGSTLFAVPDHGHSVLSTSDCTKKALRAFVVGQALAPCKRTPQHRPRPFSTRELDCLVRLQSALKPSDSEILPAHPPRALRGCARLLRPRFRASPS